MLEAKVVAWILEKRARHQRVSQKMIRVMAKEFYLAAADNEKPFTASAGWLDQFLKRNNFGVRRRTTLAQKEAGQFTEKLVNFVTYTTQQTITKKIKNRDVIAVDETAVWFDMVGSTTVEGRGACSVQLQTTGHEKSHFTVVLAYRCHISTATKAELKRGYNMTTAVIPGGCTKYIQAPDVVWNKPFKASLHESYDTWMAGDTDKEYTAGGNLKAPAHHLLVKWVLSAWDKLDVEQVKKSFKVG